jgi:hypothetical protein
MMMIMMTMMTTKTTAAGAAAAAAVLRDPCDRQISDIYPLRFVSEGASLAAVSQSGRRIIEACMNGHHSRADHTHTEYLQHASNEAYAKTEKFLDMKKAVDVGAYRCSFYTVHLSTRGR